MRACVCVYVQVHVLLSECVHDACVQRVCACVVRVVCVMRVVHVV